MSEQVHIALSTDEALVAFEWLLALDKESLESAERTACDGLVAALEKQLTAPFERNYGALVTAARARLTEGR